MFSPNTFLKCLKMYLWLASNYNLGWCSRDIYAKDRHTAPFWSHTGCLCTPWSQTERHSLAALSHTHLVHYSFGHINTQNLENQIVINFYYFLKIYFQKMFVDFFCSHVRLLFILFFYLWDLEMNYQYEVSTDMTNDWTGFSHVGKYS